MVKLDMNNYGIRPDYKARAQPDYFVDNLQDGRLWQLDCYKFALEVANFIHNPHVFDIGCGNAEKLAPMPYPVTAVDYGANLGLAIKHGLHRYVDFNLEYGLPALGIDAQSVVICADVIEHLKDPTLLAQGLEALTHTAGAVIISTPDRLRLYGHDHNGEPANPHHAREWTLAELTGYLQSLGANIRLTGYTRCNDISNVKSTILIAGGVAGIDFEAIAKQVGIEVAYA